MKKFEFQRKYKKMRIYILMALVQGHDRYARARIIYNIVLRKLVETNVLSRYKEGEPVHAQLFKTEHTSHKLYVNDILKGHEH